MDDKNSCLTSLCNCRCCDCDCADIGNMLCGTLDRSQYLDAVEFYTETTQANPETSTMVIAGLLLAEDRILSYAAPLMADNYSYTSFVPDATFYFEAETDPEKLLQQRRRWINGTVMGYIWIFSNMRLLFSSHMKMYQKLGLFFLLSCQMAMYFMVGLSPGLFMLGFHFALLDILPSPRYDPKYHDYLLGGYVALYLVFVYKHCTQEEKGKPRLQSWMMDIITLVNAAVSICMLVMLVKQVILMISGHSLTLLTFVVVLTMGLPFLLGIHSPTSFGYMLLYCIPFYLYLPTMVPYWSSYSFARFWELTWGNRPSDSLASMHTDAGHKRTAEEVKKELFRTAHFVCGVLVLMNLLVVILITALSFNPDVLIYLAITVAIWAIAQMLLSAIFLICWRLSDLACFFGHMCTVLCCSCRREEAPPQQPTFDPTQTTPVPYQT